MLVTGGKDRENPDHGGTSHRGNESTYPHHMFASGADVTEKNTHN